MWLEDVERLLAAWPARRAADRAGLNRAAVLVPLYVTHGELWVVLTRRAEAGAGRTGAYAFPGGASRAEDRDEFETALREAREEVRIDPSAVIVLGRLDDVLTATGYAIAPVVGAVPFPLSVEPATEEVESVATVPFAYLARPEAIEEGEEVIAGETVVSPVFHYRSHCISGPTARVVADLVNRLTGGAEPPGR